MNDIFKRASHPNTNTRAFFLKISQPLGKSEAITDNH